MRDINKIKRENILKIVETFYAESYKKMNKKTFITKPSVRRLPEITTSEINTALCEMRSPGEDGIVIESIKMGENKLLQAVKILFNKCLSTGATPSEWINAVIMLLQKQGDITSHTYISYLLCNKLDLGFRTGYGTNDHPLVLKNLIEKSMEYNKCQVLNFVDYEKAFDSVDQHTMLKALSD